MFKTDPDVEQKGVWLEYGEGRRLLCARAGGANKHFQKTMERVSKPFLRAIQADALPAEDALAMLIEVFSLAIVMDWEGVTVDDLEGNDDATLVPFSPDACRKFFKALPDIFHDVRESASKAALYRSHIDKAASGN